MIFTSEDYTYVPPEMAEEIYEADIENDPSFEHREAKWEWGVGGTNLPPYNHWYWETHKDEIQARRAELAAEREAEARAHGAYRDSNSKENYLKDLTDAQKEYMEKAINYQKNVDKKELGTIVDNRPKKKEEEKPKTIPIKPKTEEDSKSKKKSGSSKGSSGSSKKKSDSDSSKAIKQKTDFGKGGKAKSLFPGTGAPKAAKSSGGKGSGSGSSKEKSSKEKKEKEEKTTSAIDKKIEKLSSELSNYKDLYGKVLDKLNSQSNTSNKSEPTIDPEKESKIDDAISEVKKESYTDDQTPVNNYITFVSELEKHGYTPVDTDEGLKLWAMYRSSEGKNVTEEELEEERKKLQHGLDTFDNAVLEHHGILGQKWYVRNGPPYPLDYEAHNSAEKKANWESSLSAAGQKALQAERKAAAGAKKAYETTKPYAKKAGAAAVKAGKATVTAAKNANEKSKAKKAAKAEAEREARVAEYQRNRDNAIKSGDSKYARDHFNELSNQEINDLLNRLDLSKRVDKANHVMTTEEKIDELMGKIAKGRDWVDKGANAWNSVARLYNTMNGDDPLPIIGENYQKTKTEIAKAQAKKEREQWFNEISKDPEKIRKYWDQLNNEEAATAAKRLGNNAKAKGYLDTSTNSNSNNNNTDYSDAIQRLEDRIAELEEEKEDKK